MSRRKVVTNYYQDLNNLCGSLNTLISGYINLINGANELNRITPAKRGDVKKALKRVDKVGKIIDRYLDTLDECSKCYNDYCYEKCKVLCCIKECDYISAETEEELKGCD